jgi:hypothetical protein
MKALSADHFADTRLIALDRKMLLECTVAITAAAAAAFFHTLSLYHACVSTAIESHRANLMRRFLAGQAAAGSNLFRLRVRESAAWRRLT